MSAPETIGHPSHASENPRRSRLLWSHLGKVRSFRMNKKLVLHKLRFHPDFVALFSPPCEGGRRLSPPLRRGSPSFPPLRRGSPSFPCNPGLSSSFSRTSSQTSAKGSSRVRHARGHSSSSLGSLARLRYSRAVFRSMSTLIAATLSGFPDFNNVRKHRTCRSVTIAMVILPPFGGSP